jgi:hypothetical protein
MSEIGKEQETSVFEEERALTPEEVVELKKKLKERPDFVHRVAGMWVVATLSEIYQKDEIKRADPDIVFASNVPQDVEDRLMQAAVLGADWGTFIQSAIELPGDEWPDSMPPQGDVADLVDKLSEEDITSVTLDTLEIQI